MNIGRFLLANSLRRAAIRLALGWLVCGGMALPAARAYVLENTAWPLGAPITLNLQLGAPSRPLLDGSTTWGQVAEAAGSVWNPNLGNGIQFQFNYDVFTPTQGDGKNTVFFSSTIYGEGFSDDVLAVTLIRSDQSVTTETDVIVNSAQQFNSYRGPLRSQGGGKTLYDLRRVLMHEFGHVLGLDHTGQLALSIMAPFITDIDTIQADDIAGVSALYVDPQYYLPTITGASATTGVAGQAFQFQVQASGAHLSYSASGLPAGLSIDPATGLISGTPTTDGVFVVHLSLSNPHGNASATLTITLQYAPVITSPTSVTAVMGIPFFYQITATNHPTSFDFGAYTAAYFGLTSNTGTGLLSGVPNFGGQQTVPISASNAAASGHANLTLSFTADTTSPYVVRTIASTEGIYGGSVLTLASDGNFYGTSPYGGVAERGCVFRLTPAGDVSILHSFSLSDDGITPYGGLVQGRDGNFYGMTSYSGANGTGTVFQITPAGTLTTIHQFSSDTGGDRRSMTLGSDGNLYGTIGMILGGFSFYANTGAVFKITPDGAFTLLHAFTPSATDSGPLGLVQAPDGNLYGACATGGASGMGFIFRITPGGDFSTIRAFTDANASHPLGAPVLAPDGNLYGTLSQTTYMGAVPSTTSFYRCTLDGTLTVLQTMGDYTTGNYPSRLVWGGDGYFYGIGLVWDSFGHLIQTVLGRYAYDGSFAGAVHTFTGPEGSLTDPMTRAADGSFYAISSNNRLLRIVPGQAPSTGVYVSLLPKLPAAHPAPGTAAVFTIRRDYGDQTVALTVNLTCSGDARAGVDYVALPATATIPAGAASVDCKVVGLNPSLGNTPAALNVQVGNGDGYTVNTNARNVSLQVYGTSSLGPSFFSGEQSLSQGVYYLAFANANVFGYYTYLSDPHFVYHFDMGYEYWTDAADGHDGIYFYDFKSGDWLYTSPTFPFPYLYDFTLRAFLYYYPDPTNPQRYNTNGVRYFYNFGTHSVISR